MFDLMKVDHNALRANQALIIGLLVLGFILNQPILVVLVMLVMLGGSLAGKPGFLPLYRGVLVRLGWVKPSIVPDHPEPHRFAQTLGGVFLLFASLALFAGLATLGWALAWLVIVLAGLNLFAGFCTGCFVYYWLNRLKVPGFNQAPPPDTFPGMRPHSPAGVQSGREG
jgi:hypothetical protein